MPAIDFSRLEAALGTPRGAIELTLLAACVALAWFADRSFGRRYAGDMAGRAGQVALGVFPIVLLVLVLIARAGFARSGKTFFLDLAIPLVIALAVIRMLVYTLRRLFTHADWLKRSERAIAYTIWAIVAFHFLGVNAEVIEMLGKVVVPLGKHDVSLVTIGQGLIVVLVTVAVSLWLSGFVEKRLMATALDINTRVVLSKVLRAVLVVVGVLISLPAIGIDLTLLSVFGGALGVGVGLGLQKLAANYIAGFAILLDRSIKLGDMVTVDGKFGMVSQVTSRYVVVRGLDGVDAIVPNETLVTTTVLNHSHHRGQIRLALPVLIAYGSDVERAIGLMEAAARDEPRVIQDPDRRAEACVAGFVDTGIALELGVWIADPENGQLGLRSAINRRILTSFAEAGIAMPFLRRDVFPSLEVPAGAPGVPSPSDPPNQST